MAEYEELRLTVTLIDNASEGLVRLRQNLRSLGSGENREALLRFQKETENLGEKLTQVRERMSTTEKVAERLGKTIGTTMRTFAAAFIANFAIDALSKFTDEMVRLNAAAKQFGIGGAQLKSLVEQMGIMGIGSQQATQAVTGFANALAELGREGGQKRHDLMKGAISNPEAMEAFIKRMTQLGSKGEIEKALNEFLDAADSVYQEELKRTEGNTGKAAQLRNQWLEKWQLDAATMAMIKGRFKEVTDAEKAEYDRRNAITQSFSTEWNKMTLQYNRFIEGLQIGLLPTIEAINKAIGTMGDKWGETVGTKIGGEIARQARAAQLMKEGKYWEAIKESLSLSFTGPLKDLDEKGWRAFLPHFTTPNESVEKRWPETTLPGFPSERFGDWPAGATPPASKMSYRGGDSEMPPIIKASLGGAPIMVPGGSGDYSRSGSGAVAELARAIRTGVFEALVDFRTAGMQGKGGGGVQNASLTTGGAGGGGGGGGNAFGGNRTSVSDGGAARDGGDRTASLDPKAGADTGADAGVGNGEGVIQAQGREAGIRKLALDQKLVGALQYAYEQTGLRARVTSGGQDPHGPRTGSHRHDYGKAGDFNLIDKDGKVVPPNDPRALSFTEHASRAGVIGGGASYMSDPNKIHLDIAGGRGGSRGAYAGSREFRSAMQRGIKARDLDRAMGNEVRSKTDSNIKLQTKVRAPAGTTVDVKGSGALSKTETTRETPIGGGATVSI